MPLQSFFSTTSVSKKQYSRIQLDTPNWVPKSTNSFGQIISANNDCTVIAAANPSTPTVNVYKKYGNSWIKMGQTISTNNVKSLYLSSTTSDDGYLIVGSSGAATVFRYIQHLDQWSQLGPTIQPSFMDNSFGWSVAINDSGTVVAIGAPYEGSKSDIRGAVYILKYNSNLMQWEPYFGTFPYSRIEGMNANAQFGTQIRYMPTIFSDLFTISAPGRLTGQIGYFATYSIRPSGAFRVSGQTVYDTEPDTGFGMSLAGGNFGLSVIVGSPYFSSEGKIERGRVQLYSDTILHNGLIENVTLFGDNEMDRFGTSVAYNQQSGLFVGGSAVGVKEIGGSSFGYFKASSRSTLDQKGKTTYGTIPNYEFTTSLAASSDGNTIIASGANGENGYFTEYKYL